MDSFVRDPPKMVCFMKQPVSDENGSICTNFRGLLNETIRF